MNKQLYKIQKSDWCVSIKEGTSIIYIYAKTRKEAVSKAKDHKGKIQLFKLSYEFKGSWVK